MKLWTLSGATALTKSFAMEDGKLMQYPYPHMAKFTSHEHEVDSIKDLYIVIQAAANAGHCLIKGNLLKALDNESRAGNTSSMDSTQWICLDLDNTRFATPDEMLKAIGLDDVSYVVQYSASYGVTLDTMGCHIFMLLSNPIKANLLKLWLQHLNLNTEALRSNIQLTKSQASLSWPLDITCCQNDKLIYIAPPTLGKGVKSTYKGERIKLVKRKHTVLDLTRIGFSAVENLKKEILALRNNLRTSSNLPPIKHKLKNIKGLEVQPGLSSVSVTDGPLYARGYVYFNFNNGDSWAYYHPEDDFEYILNFKGEPAYLTKEIMPEYYVECLAKRGQINAVDDSGIIPIVFRDINTATYWNGYWNPAKNEHQFYTARDTKQCEHFMLNHNRTMGDFVPIWEVIFDPTSDIRLDIERKILNNWHPSDFYNRKMVPLAQCGPETWPTIDYVYKHAIGQDEGLQAHWRNWLAFIVQYREKTMTSWLLSGTQGTGKGFITNTILRPMIGEQHVIMKHQRELKSQFNSYLRTALIAVIDELDITQLDDASVIDSDLKNFITEPYLSIRAMHQESKQVKNYTNFIFYSNRYQAMSLPANDRRFNIGERQENMLPWSEALKQQVIDELFHHFSYLNQVKVDAKMASTPYKNKARQDLIDLSKTSADAIASAILEGRIDYLLEQLPDQNTMDIPSNTGIKASAYHSLIKNLMESLADEETKGYLRFSRDDLFTIFDWCVGNIPASSTKFTQYMNHRGIQLKPMRFNNVVRPGIERYFDISHTQALEFLQTYFPTSLKKSRSNLRVVKTEKVTT